MDCDYNNGQVISVSISSIYLYSEHSVCPDADIYSKYEHSKTFGLITSGLSNVVWAPDEPAQDASSRHTGAGRAVVSANEEVLCWDVKKGELLGRWRDVDCNAEVTAIARSDADRDIYAVG